MLGLRLLAFTVLIPGTVAVAVPWLILDRTRAADGNPMMKVTGFLFVTAGITLYLTSTLRFLREGRGTPAIWFTRPLRWLIGEEPGVLVRSGLYRFTRNPMYLGVVTVVAGQGLWHGSYAIIIYAILLWVAFHCVVVYIEEPHLRRKCGNKYAEFCRTTPRWIRIRKN